MTPPDHSEKKVFMHLSDIHFVKNFSDESKYDLDSAARATSRGGTRLREVVAAQAKKSSKALPAL